MTDAYDRYIIIGLNNLVNRTFDDAGRASSFLLGRIVGEYCIVKIKFGKSSIIDISAACGDVFKIREIIENA